MMILLVIALVSWFIGAQWMFARVCSVGHDLFFSSYYLLLS